MVYNFGEKLIHNKEINLRKDGLNMTVFYLRLKFVNVYMFVTCKREHSPSSNFNPNKIQKEMP